jgi:hypothetical protein
MRVYFETADFVSGQGTAILKPEATLRYIEDFKIAGTAGLGQNLLFPVN